MRVIFSLNKYITKRILHHEQLIWILWISTTRVPDIPSFSIHKTEIDNRYVVQVILCSCSHGCQTLLFLHQIKFENATYMQFICFPRDVTGICLWWSWFARKLYLREPQLCFAKNIYSEFCSWIHFFILAIIQFISYNHNHLDTYIKYMRRHIFRIE